MKLKTEILGSDKHKTIAMLHGWGLCSKVFYPVVDSLKDRYRIVLIDMPGYGINNAIPANRCDGIVSSLEETIPENCALFGWSLGGILAQKFAITNSKHIRALITVSCSPRFTSNPQEGWPGTDAKLLKKFSTLISQNNCQAVLDKFLSLQAMGSERMREDIKTIKGLLAEAPSPSYYELQAGLKTLMDEDLRNNISRIQCPSLHIFGLKDRLCPASTKNIWAKKDNSHTIVFEQSSHAPFITQTKEFNEQLLLFLDKYYH